MTNAFLFDCPHCAFIYAGPIGRIHAARNHIISVFCPDCEQVEARTLNWTQEVPDGEFLSQNQDQISGVKVASKNQVRIDPERVQIEWHDYSLYQEDMFTCWTCEGSMLIWDKPLCPCCGHEMKKIRKIDLQ